MAQRSSRRLTQVFMPACSSSEENGSYYDSNVVLHVAHRDFSAARYNQLSDASKSVDYLLQVSWDATRTPVDRVTDDYIRAASTTLAPSHGHSN
jgi:hypothetical protein